ncbi:MAG: BON domain-containing protein [Nitrospirota bacterium]
MNRAPSILTVLLAGMMSVCMPGAGTMALAGEGPMSTRPIVQLISEQTQTDEQVKYKVEEQLRTDGRIEWEMLDVDVQHGEVTLYGEVETEDQKGLASLIATTVPGVRRLTNSILVAQPVSNDLRLRKAVWSTLRDVDALRGQTQTLRVQVKNSVATLSGSVEQPIQVEAAVKAVQSVEGVKHVVNALRVQPRPFQTEREKLRKEGREEIP